MYLYAEEENQKALATYQKLGMEIIKGMSMHGYDFIYEKNELPKASKDYTFKHETLKDTNHNLVDILKTESNDHKPLCVFEGETLVGYAEYFEEFSDWRYGRTINIMKLLLTKDGLDVFGGMLNYLKEKSPGLSVSAIRFYTS